MAFRGWPYKTHIGAMLGDWYVQLSAAGLAAGLAWLSRPAAHDRVAGFLRAAAPLMSWLDSHVGVSTEPAPRRGGR